MKFVIFLFTFCAHVDVIKNTDVLLRAHADYLSFRPQRACDRNTIGSYLKGCLAVRFRLGYLAFVFIMIKLSQFYRILLACQLKEDKISYSL